MTNAVSLRKTDAWLIMIFPLTLISGIMLHAARHHSELYVFGPLLYVHILSGFLLIVFSIRHIIQHWPWFKSLFSKFSKHSKVTMLTAIFFVLVSITGLGCIIANGTCGIYLSHAHSMSAVLFTVFAVWHFLKRIKIFKSLHRKRT